MINVSRLYCGLAGESDELRYSRRSPAGPVVVYNCTAQCNLKCLHCYSASGAEMSDNELNTDQAKRLLSEFARAKTPVVLFSGGEPLLRHDLFELVSEAGRLGLRSVLSTNGTLIDTGIAERLAKVGIGYVGVSIDGEEESHDQFRGSVGSFKAALEGIGNCKKAGIKTGLRFTITRTNAEQIDFIFELAASVGVRRICFYHLISSGRSVENCPLAADIKQTRLAVDRIIEKTSEFVAKGLVDEVLTVGNHADGPYLLMKMAREKSLYFEEAKELLLAAGGNRSGEKIACVSWDGSVYADQFWHNYSLGNIKDKSFERIWKDSTEPVLVRLRKKSEFADSRCSGCRWFELCKGNFRFLGLEPDAKYWINEPACYLRAEEMVKLES